MDELRLVDLTDFAVGAYQLSKHFGLKIAPVSSTDFPSGTVVSVLGQPGDYGRQLALSSPSDFPSGRVPLYLCPCGDLECGATTVSITESDGTIVWSDFGNETPSGDDGFWQNDFMRRTGPFNFDKSAYLYTLSPFLKQVRK